MAFLFKKLAFCCFHPIFALWNWRYENLGNHRNRCLQWPYGGCVFARLFPFIGSGFSWTKSFAIHWPDNGYGDEGMPNRYVGLCSSWCEDHWCLKFRCGIRMSWNGLRKYHRCLPRDAWLHQERGLSVFPVKHSTLNFTLSTFNWLYTLNPQL